jgi:hypothetical protein
MFATVGLFEAAKGKAGEKKRMIVNNMEIHCICVGRRHSERH